MGKYLILMDWQNQHSKHGCTTKTNLRVQSNSHPNPNDIITEIEKSTLKFLWKHKIPQIAKVMLSKMSNAGGVTIPDFKLFYREVKRAWYWHKNSETE
jgi:hypothetical protein